MSTSTKANLIILAKSNSPEDAGFYQMLLKDGSHLRDKAIVYILPSVEDLHFFLTQVNNEFSFILFIHVGSKGLNPGVDGAVLTEELRNLPYYSRLTYYYTSREGSTGVIGQPVIWTMEMNFKTFSLDAFIRNKVIDLKVDVNKISVDDIAGNSFVVLTALDEHENDIFRAYLEETSIQELNLQTLKGRFRPLSTSLSDYLEPFILTKQLQMGMVDTAFSSASIFYEFNPRYLLMSGVCGGRKSKVKLFDIIIPSKVFDFSFGSLEEGKFVNRDLDAKIEPELISYLNTTENKALMKRRMLALVDTPQNNWEKYVRDVNFHFDVMACGPWVIKTEDFLETLSKEKNDLIRGLEMESYSIGRASEIYRGAGLKTLVIKSVMDYTDAKKGDEFNNIPVKKIAGYISYLCTRAIMGMLNDNGQKFSWNKSRKM